MGPFRVKVPTPTTTLTPSGLLLGSLGQPRVVNMLHLSVLWYTLQLCCKEVSGQPPVRETLRK